MYIYRVKKYHKQIAAFNEIKVKYFSFGIVLYNKTLAKSGMMSQNDKQN